MVLSGLMALLRLSKARVRELRKGSTSGKAVDELRPGSRLQLVVQLRLVRDLLRC